MQGVHGIFLLNKPLGLSSNVALQRVKKHFHASKAGHTGSLDPLATGMLPICLGEATKFSQYDLDSNKTYIATGLLGQKTSTGDSEGVVINAVDTFDVTEDRLLDVLHTFQGETLQTPSMYSALKYQGVPLYRYARKGIQIDRIKRPIMVYDLQLLEFKGKQFQIQVTCSKGTYIRNLVEDIGERLGTFAHVIQLHRAYTASYSGQPMYSLEHLQQMNKEESLNCLLPMDAAIQHLDVLPVSKTETLDLCQGKIVHKTGGLEGKCVRLYDEKGIFMGLATWITNDSLRVKRLIATNNKNTIDL